jgi:hypothetical protein
VTGPNSHARGKKTNVASIGDPGALAELGTAAQAKVEKKGFLGIVNRSSPACGAAEGAEAARRIEAARTTLPH